MGLVKVELLVFAHTQKVLVILRPTKAGDQIGNRVGTYMKNGDKDTVKVDYGCQTV